MKAHFDSDTADKTTVSRWHETAIYSAVIAGVFSTIVVGLLIVNYLQIKVLDPLQAERLQLLKVKIVDRPNDEQLLSQIRQLDLQIRQNRVRRQSFSRKGAFLLCGGLIVLLISAKFAAASRKKLPHPKPQPDPINQQLRQARQARWAVTTSLVLLGASALFFATRPVVNLEQADIGTASYPTIAEIKKNWPRFRGPAGAGVSAYNNIPSAFDAETGQGILWKAQVPLPGFNSPVVWADRVFLSGGDENTRQVYCFDAASGRLLWIADVPSLAPSNAEPVEPMEDTGFAAPTLVTDGKRVYAIFATGDIAAFDFDGNIAWSKNLGVPQSTYGYASSLAMFRNLVLVQYDQGNLGQGKSSLIALDGYSGRIVWQTKRPVPNSWTSPIVPDVGDRFQIITAGDPWVIAYDPNSGEELWRAKCLGTDVAPSPIYANGFVFAIEPYTKLVAIRADGRGDVTKTHIAWIAEDNIPDICSPVSNGELVFLLTTEGILTCYKVKDGTKLWEKDLEKSFHASPTLVGDTLYLLSDKGTMLIVAAAERFKLLGTAQLNRRCYASPAFVNGRIYIRAEKYLYCVGDKN